MIFKKKVNNQQIGLGQIGVTSLDELTKVLGEGGYPERFECLDLSAIIGLDDRCFELIS